MAYIRVDLRMTMFNGQAVTFKSPASCSGIEGLKIYYPAADGTTTSKTFALADAHGNNVGSIDLFAANVIVKVILDTETSMAFVQNADTNSYLEGRFTEVASAASAAQTTANEAKAAIPTKTSQLTNDSGYLTSVPVTSVNGKTGAVSLGASDVGARPDTWTPSVTDLGFTTESWVFTLEDESVLVRSVCLANGTLATDELIFTLEDGSTVTKAVYAG